MHYLSKHEIININKKVTSRYGGLFLYDDNINIEGAIECIVETISARVFGFEMYPSIYNKAAFYIHNIIQNHIFHDALVFLEINGYTISPDTPKEYLINFAINIAEGRMDMESIAAWFELQTIKKWV